MMSEWKAWLVRTATGVFLLAMTTACETTPRNLVVLLPEADGGVGEVTVTTAGGVTTLKTAGAATGFDAPKEAPPATITLEDEKLGSIFKSAISAQPTPPTGFTLYFRTGKTRMARSSEALWPTILAEIRSRAAPDVSIIGHTDRAGPDNYNERLSRRRARVIRKRLVKAGIDTGIIEFSWHGEKNPIIRTPDDVSERRNRRVEIFVR